jgi:hypothetical protein
MKNHEKELFSAIAKAEKMSGFDSYDSLEGDMSYFDDMDDFEGDNENDMGPNMSFASGPSQLAVSDPYVIQYVNSTAGALPAVVFGYNDNFGAFGFGNPLGITVTNLQGGTYGRLIAQSNNKFFKIGKFRFQSGTAAQLQQTYSLVHVDANGKQYSTPLNLAIMKDAYQFQSDIIDVTKNVTIDGNTSITFSLLALTTLVLSMFPIAVMSGKAKLNGGHVLNQARAPRLSGKNVAPVIIQTGQSVTGVAKM